MSHTGPTSRVLLLAVLICLFNFIYTKRSTENENDSKTTVGDLALAVFRRQYVGRALIFRSQCSSDWRFYRKMLEQFQTGIIRPTTLWLLDHAFFRTGILVDLRDCPTAKTIFQQGVVQPYFNSSYRWLVVSDPQIEETTALFQDRKFRLDTSITAAFFRDDSYILSDIYKLSTSDTVLEEPVGRFHVDLLIDWVDAENAPFRSRVHRNLTTGLHVLKPTSEPASVVMERFNRLRGHPEVPATHFSMQDFHVFLALCNVFNISKLQILPNGTPKRVWNLKPESVAYCSSVPYLRINPVVYSFSGYPNKDNVYSGVLGGLQRHEVEISASKLLVDGVRMTIDDYHAPCDLLDLNVIYYVSGSLETPDALFQPFAPSLWIAIAVACAVLILGLWYAGHWEMRSDETEVDLTATATILLVLGTFNGQGHVTDLRWYSTRAVIIVALMMGFLSVSVYSAVIVRFLLSTPAPNIRNKRDFMASPLTMAVENYYHFSKAIFDEKMGDAMRELYNKKIVPPKGGGFMPVSDGFPGVLSQRWVMFAQVNNILLEMAKATPGQVCRLAWIRDIYTHQRVVCPLMAKRSDLKNLFTRGYILARERGLQDRERQRHLAARISCQAEHRRQWTPVKVQIISAAIGLVFTGILVAVLILVQEWIVASAILSSRAKKTAQKGRNHVHSAWK